MADMLLANDVLQITYRGQQAAQTVMMVFHARVVGPVNTPASTSSVVYDLAAKLANATDQRMAAIRACVSPELSIGTVRVQKVKPTRQIYSVVTGGGPGLYAGASNTPNVAVSITKQTTKVGRKGIGRFQLPGVPSSGYAAGQILPAYKTLLEANVCDKFFGSFGGGTLYPDYTFSWCLPAGGVDADYDVFHCLAQNTVRTMHRRTVGLGI